MQDQILHAKTLMEKGFAIIPLYKDSKANGDKEIITRDYTLAHLQKPLNNHKGEPLWHTDGNQGLNLEKSGLTDIDLENFWSIMFGELWLDSNTLTLGRERPDGTIQVTHYFYKNEDKLEEDIKLQDNKSIEYRVKGQTVVYGRTKDKENGEMLTRTWVNVKMPIVDKDLEKKYRKIAFASAIAPYVKSANTGALKLDACLKRYTTWTSEERIEFLLDFYSKVLPNDRDTSRPKFQRIVTSNDKGTKNAGVQSYSEYIGVSPLEVKKWLSYIGKTPGEEGYNKKPSRRDFLQNGIDMKSLMTENIPELKFVVNPILPEGLVCIAGRPKAMKSWQMLKLCYCVENGLDYLGHKVEKGNALYLALEDSKRRLKDRTIKLGHDNVENFPTTDIESPYLGFGLEEDLKRWIEGVPMPKLIVIDTLARVKPRTGFSKGTAYDMDNELLRQLQQLAITSGVCIAFITHLSKAQQDYSFDKITGSVGLQGMTDAMWLIDRGDNTPNASITGRGRDIMDFEYSVKWNDLTMTYDFVGNKTETELQENRKIIIDAMKYFADKEGKKDVRPLDIIKYYGYTAQSKQGKNISRTMQRMAINFEIMSGVKYGYYNLKNLDENQSCPF